MRYAVRHFDDFEQFEVFLNRANGLNWKLHSWQDVGIRGIDIRAVFVQSTNQAGAPLP